MKPRILLTGKSGQLGFELARTLPSIGEVIPTDRSELDLANENQLRRTIREIKPTLIVNAAAYTAVDQAESDEPAARAINADAPRVMADEARSLNAALIHFSTDYVFDGTATSPYPEGDQTGPINAYGRTKLAGEEAIGAANIPHLIFRTSWLYGPRGRNFLLTILRLAAEKPELRIVSDQIGAPTSVVEIAPAVTQILTAVAWHPELLAEHSGTYHLSAPGQTSWHEFAESIIALAKISRYQSFVNAATHGRPLIVERIAPIPTADYPTPARRPLYSVLDNSKVRRTFNISLPSWKKQLRDVFIAANKLAATTDNP
jgi:dTDP-4-dehydrorhamnose reductase